MAGIELRQTFSSIEISSKIINQMQSRCRTLAAKIRILDATLEHLNDKNAWCMHKYCTELLIHEHSTSHVIFMISANMRPSEWASERATQKRVRLFTILKLIWTENFRVYCDLLFVKQGERNVWNWCENFHMKENFVCDCLDGEWCHSNNEYQVERSKLFSQM